MGQVRDVEDGSVNEGSSSFKGFQRNSGGMGIRISSLEVQGGGSSLDS